MQNKLITAGQLVVEVIRADVVRGVDSDAGTRPGQPATPYPGAGGRLAACLTATLPYDGQWTVPVHQTPTLQVYGCPGYANAALSYRASKKLEELLQSIVRKFGKQQVKAYKLEVRFSLST